MENKDFFLNAYMSRGWKDTNPGVIAATSAVEVVVEDAFSPVLEDDPDEAKAAWDARGPHLDDFPQTPLGIAAMNYPISWPQV